MADVQHPEDARFRLAMAMGGIAMASVTLDGRWQEVNPALCRLLGRSAEQLLQRPVQDFVHPEEAGAVVMSRERALLPQGDVAAPAERRYLGASGECVEVREHLAPVRDANGKPQGFLVQLHDLGELRRVQGELGELNESFERCVQERTAALEAASRRWESFAYGVSHDLRAPLRAIDGFAKQLERHAGPGLDSIGQDSLQRIRAASQRMGGLIDSLLELSRIGRAELRPERVDVSLLADWSAAELQDAHPQRRSRVTVQPGLEVVGDERLLKTLLAQLLGNAWQFVAKDAEVQVEVTGSRTAEGLQIAMRDHGIGFDMAYADKLFQPFQRLHGNEDGAGNGLGLSIAQQVVERHGGRIWADSVPGQGTTFHATLRDQRASEAAA